MSDCVSWLEDVQGSLLELENALLGTSGRPFHFVGQVAAGGAGGVAASSGVLGVASAVGTAGTGTAIGTLHGAALTSAQLAWIGGSVASGTVIVAVVGFGGAYLAKRRYGKLKGRAFVVDELGPSHRDLFEFTAELSKLTHFALEQSTTIPDARPIQRAVCRLSIQAQQKVEDVTSRMTSLQARALRRSIKCLERIGTEYPGEAVAA